MKLEPEHEQALSELVKGYCEKHKIIGPHQRLVVTLGLEPVDLVIIRTAVSINATFLDQDAILLFKDFCAKCGETRTGGKVAGVLKRYRNWNEEGRPEGLPCPTVRDVITLFNDKDEHDVEVSWYCIRGLSTKGIRLLDRWLASLGLKRGMVLETQSAEPQS